jgi:CheY-like chemotaxis protein
MKSAVRIMVVDDEKIVRESLSVWLQKFGYEVVPVEGGQEALDLLDREESSQGDRGKTEHPCHYLYGVCHG